MRVSKRLVDGQIASIPALQGPDGKFSPEIYKSVLAQQRLTDAALRADMTREIFARQLIVPTVGASQIPMQVALPYAALLLEKRQGHVGFVPATARSEEHTSELQTLMRISYAVFCLKQNKFN